MQQMTNRLVNVPLITSNPVLSIVVTGGRVVPVLRCMSSVISDEL